MVVSGMNSASEIVNQAAIEAEKAGATAGVGLGMTFMFFVWAVGDVITGLLALMTRPKS